MTNKTRVTIPETFMGVPLKGAMERVLSKSQTTQPDESKNQPFESKNLNLVAHDYVQITQIKKIISRFELKDYNNLNWQDTHFKLNENGLYMPTIPEFMVHFKNVVQSYKSEGRNPLFDAGGNPISKDEVKEIYLHLTKDHIAIYGNQKGAWTWLDAKFSDENGMKVHSEHRTFKDSNGNKLLKPNKIEPLETCLMKDCFADFNSLSSQGLPITEAEEKYKQGENIYFWKPVSGKVARFDADSGRADLDCVRDSDDVDSDLGVFAVINAGSNARQNAGGIVK